PAAPRAKILRALPGPDPLRDRRRPLRPRDAAAGVRRRALRDLLPLPGDRGRVLRLRAGAGAAAGALAHLRPGPAGVDPAQGLSRERRALAPPPLAPTSSSGGAVAASPRFSFSPGR